MATVYASPRMWQVSQEDRDNGLNEYTCTQSQANASYIWSYFKGKGWSNSAIAGLVGNTTHESYNNPAFHEVGGAGFGIVQWTPSSNYTVWANPRGFPTGMDTSNPEQYLFGQCERIMYELNTGIEFFGNSRYDRNWLSYKTWDSYIHNDLSPEDAAWLFMSNYERPNYNAAMGSLNARQTYARRWYTRFANNSFVQNVKISHMATRWAIGIANNTVEYNGYTDHGYDQGNRWGERGDFDCSALVITAYDQYGLGLKAAGATYTGDMRGVMLAKGFQDVTNQVDLRTGSGLVEGDVLINYAHHAVIATGDGSLVQASINEFGSVTGGKPGDQTGTEIAVVPYYVYGRGGWNCVLRYDGYASGFGISGTGTGVSIVRAIPVTKTDWMANDERNG